MGLFSSNDIKIELPKYLYSPGETISGKITTSISNSMKADALSVSLFGVVIHTEREIINGQSREVTRNTEFYRENIMLGGKGTYDSLEYTFRCTIPENIWEGSPKRSLPEIPGLPDGVTKGLNILANVLSSGIPRMMSYQFFIEARLDIPWAIDLTEKAEITVTRPVVHHNGGNI